MSEFGQGKDHQAGTARGGTISRRAAAPGWRVALAGVTSLALLTLVGCSSTALSVAVSPNSGAASAGGGSVAPANPNGSVGPSQPGGTTSPGSTPGVQPGVTPSLRPSGPGPGVQPSVPTGVRPGARSVLFGGDLPLAAEEPKLGRKLAIVRVYDLLGQRFPDRHQASLLAQGATALVSLDTYPPGPSYAAIAAGRDDGTIRAFLSSVNQAAIKYRLRAIYVSFEHEANDGSTHRGLGSPAEFVRAWDHVHQLAVSAHLDWNDGGRLHWALILTHYAYLRGDAGQFWPGTGEVDVIAADGYNSGTCRSGRNPAKGRPVVVTPASLFTTTVSFAKAHGNLPVFISEWGSVAFGSPSIRVNFIHQMEAFVDANPDIAAALYWDSQVPHCNYEINNSASSLAALASMGHAPQMQAGAAEK